MPPGLEHMLVSVSQDRHAMQGERSMATHKGQRDNGVNLVAAFAPVLIPTNILVSFIQKTFANNGVSGVKALGNNLCLACCQS